jgi:hypothetical protein
MFLACEFGETDTWMDSPVCKTEDVAKLDGAPTYSVLFLCYTLNVLTQLFTGVLLSVSVIHLLIFPYFYLSVTCIYAHFDSAEAQRGWTSLEITRWKQEPEM